MLPSDGGFQVQPETLVAASNDLAKTSDRIASFTGSFHGQADSGMTALAGIGALSGWMDFTSAWGSGFDRLARAVQVFGYNTEAAAVAYENADQQALPPPKPAAPPPKPDDHCKPDLFGRMPKDCYLA